MAAVRLYNGLRSRGYTQEEALATVRQLHGEAGAADVAAWQAAQRL